MRRSPKIRDMSSPVLDMIAKLLKRGTASGQFSDSLDPLRLYVLMVAQSQFHLSNVHTLSIIFASDLSSHRWRALRMAAARKMLRAFLKTI